MAAAAAALAGADATRGVSGEVRLLVVLATWGPEPVPATAARAAVAETTAYVAEASFGRVQLRAEVTPWLRAYAAPLPSCDLAAVERDARSAAAAAGYDASAYTQLAFVFPRISCPWAGAYFENDIWANGDFDRHLLAHELGHVWGVSEEGPTWSCDGAGCSVENYGSPYSVMGHGFGDFNAFEKATFEWLGDVAEPRAGAPLTLGAIDRPSTHAQALRVVTHGDEYWLEYRPPDPRWRPGRDQASDGIIVHAGHNGLGTRPQRFPQHNLLLLDPAGRGRPSIQAGETFAVPGAFSVTVAAADPGSPTCAFAGSTGSSRGHHACWLRRWSPDGGRSPAGLAPMRRAAAWSATRCGWTGDGRGSCVG